MKNTVTFETAVALKEAGFPQPEPEGGQMWFDRKKTLFVFFAKFPKTGVGYTVAPIQNPHSGWYFDHASRVFAPTATDILEQLPGNDIGYYPVNSQGWVSFSDYGETTNEDKNPHELAAKLYLLNTAEK